ncbi:MAG: DUF1877 family protein [Kofleriaceae bacterium]
MDVLLCSLSAKRLAMLQEDADVLAELITARHEVEIPGLIDLGATWHALDLVLLGDSGDAVLGDAVLARSGNKLKARGAQARVLAPARVVVVSKALGEVATSMVKDRYPSLYGKEVHANYGQEKSAPGDNAYLRDSVKKIHDKEIRELEMALAGVTALYAAAVGQKHSMLSVII